MVALAGYSISKIFVKNDENKKDNIIMLVAMILIYPIMQMNSAGWAATTINYIWPMALGLFSLATIAVTFGKKTPLIAVENIIYMLCN